MESAHDDLNSEDLWETLGITENSAVYEFTKAFAKTALTKYENLGEKKGRGRKFGKIGGELINLGAFPGPSRPSPHSKAIKKITVLGLQSVADYVDQLIQARTKISIISIINAKSSKSFDETFLLCFIIFALHTYDKYKVSLQYINLEAPGEKTNRENKLQAIQMLAEYAGALCFSALLKCESKKEDEFLRKLSKTNFKKDFKSQWTAATLVNLYYWAQEDDGTAKKFKKVITPYELFVKGKLDNILDEEDSSGFKFYQQESKENSWDAFLKMKKPENLLPARPGLIPVKSLLEEDREALDFFWAPIDLELNIENYARILHDFLVRDESFSRDVTGTNLVKDLHAKVDEQNSKLNELLEKLDEVKCSTESKDSLRFQIKKPIQTFIGRQDFLKDLHQKLNKPTPDLKNTRADKNQTPLWVIAGPAGIGKTEALRMYIHKYGHEYNHIVWIDAGNRSSAQAQFRVKLATELRVRTEFQGRPKAFETIVKEIYTKMCLKENRKSGSVLIIFDNADCLSDDSGSKLKGIQAYLPPQFSRDNQQFIEPTILVTSRNKNWDLLQNNTTVIILDPWTQSDCVIFCLEHLKLPDTQENRTDAAELGHYFSFSPFALQAATAVIQKRQKTSADLNYEIRDFIENYKKCDSRTILKTPPIENSPRTGPQKNLMLMDLWNVTFQTILKFKNGDLAIKIICFAAYLSPLCFTVEILKSLLPQVEHDNFVQALDLLENYFVIQQSQNSLDIHPIIRDIIKETLKSEAKQRILLSQKTYLNHSELLVHLSTGLVQYLEGRLKKPLGHSPVEPSDLIDNFLTGTSLLTELESLSTKDTENAVYLMDTIWSILGQSYELIIDYNRILDIYQTLLQKVETHQGPEHTYSLTLKMKTGDVLLKQGRYSDAKDIYTQVYTAQKKLVGRDHTQTMATQACIAEACKCLGDYAGALKLLCAVLEQRRKCCHPIDDVVALTLRFNLAILIYEHGEYADALKLFEQVLTERSREAHGQGADPKITVFSLQIQTWIARVLVKQEKYDKAIVVYTALIETSKTVRGLYHRDTLLLKSDYATTLSCLDDHETAQNILEGVLEYQNRTLGWSILELAETENNLAHVRVQLDDTKSAIEMYAHVLQVRSAHLGPEHPLTLNTKEAWGSALCCEGKFDESTKLFRDVLIGRRNAIGEYHPDTIQALQYLSQALFEQGDFKMAARFAGNITELKKRKSSLLADHPHLVRNQQLLDLSIAKLTKGLQDCYEITKPPPPPPLQIPAWIFVEAGSVLNNPASKYCFHQVYQRNLRLDGKQISCCTLKMWTKLIATIQIIVCVVSFFLNVLNSIPIPTTSSYYSHSPASLSNESYSLNLDRRSDGDDFRIYKDLHNLLSYRTSLAFMDFISILTGCILYVGAHYEKQALLLIWVIAAGLAIGFYGIFLMYCVYPIFAGSMFASLAFVNLFIFAMYEVFCFYIVSRHRRELREHLIREPRNGNSSRWSLIL